ncbi:hypothetical protein BGZ61DRAFT_534488 [Ilyonectria robusta]|uniref:uncharacterized protein n=1 Tax=Ilyonectria robusta TaxID=1079257 RepID=UPI001E8E711A|nr:uncharacterized protein BGZ61DRAFT_534488 [Ilyonectria robusta]KAH8685340.1 hypothetical protein BGZ61DRAFT_534488 [Ilyonectria robusta]
MPLVLRSLTSPDLDAPNEASEVYGGIQRMIYHLYRLANIIRSSTQIDRFARAASIDVSPFRSYDEQHVKTVFPSTALYLRNRLLAANTRRRQLLRYNAEHQARLAGGQDAEVDQAVSTEEEPSLLPPSTEATEFKMRPGDEADLDSSDTQSVAKTISSIAFSETTRETIRLPVRPLDQDGNPSTDFQCPICCVIVHVPNNSAWIKHVFRDLGAYICTFEKCPMSSQMFESRTSWFNHEIDLHRKQWQCNTTGHLTYSDESAFRRHLAEQHNDWISGSHSQSIINSCEQRRIPKCTECPFCRVPRQTSDNTNSRDDIGDPKMIPAAKLKQHLAQHMERLALFTLPRTCFDPDDEESCASAMPIAGSDGSGSNLSEILGSIAFSSDGNQEDAKETSSDTGAKKAATTEEAQATTETQSKAETGRRNLPILVSRRAKWPDAKSSCGHEIQTKEIGWGRAWLAQGPAIENFHRDIQPQVETILSNVDLQNADIFIRVYMIGKSEETSSPTLFVCCTNLSVAQRVMESLRNSPVIGNYAFTVVSNKFPLEQPEPIKRL